MYVVELSHAINDTREYPLTLVTLYDLRNNILYNGRCILADVNSTHSSSALHRPN
jgi:hypothetical protein